MLEVPTVVSGGLDNKKGADEEIVDTGMVEFGEEEVTIGKVFEDFVCLGPLDPSFLTLFFTTIVGSSIGLVSAYLTISRDYSKIK